MASQGTLAADTRPEFPPRIFWTALAWTAAAAGAAVLAYGLMLPAEGAASRRFDRAFAPASGTDVSLTCLVTARFDPFVPLPVTLLEAVRASGRVTHAIYPSEVLRWVPRTLLTRGLDGHDVVVNDRGAQDIGRYTTAIETTDGEARVTGTQTESAANAYRSVGTITYTTTKAITEHGLFNDLTAGTLMDRTVFAAINVVNTNAIEFTYTITITAGS